jgi:hypothetical protein
MAWTDKYLVQGGAGLGDGSSEANGWTWANGVITANVSALDRVNVKSNAQYTPGATSITASGSLNNWIWWRGYNSSIGDLVYARTNSGHGVLDLTDYPDFAVTGQQSMASGARYQAFENFKFSQSLAGIVIGGAAADGGLWLRNVSIINTNTAANARAFQWDNNGEFINCDFRSDCSGGTVFDMDERGFFFNCRFHTEDTSTTKLIQHNGSPIFVNCLFTAKGSAAATGVQTNSAAGNPAPTFINCTFYNLASAVTLPNVAQTGATIPRFVNCVFSDCTTAIDDLNAAAPWDVMEANCFFYNVTNIYTNVAEEIPAGRNTGSGSAGAIFEDTTDCVLKSTSTGYGSAWPFHNDLGWTRHADPAGGGGTPGNVQGGMQ